MANASICLWLNLALLFLAVSPLNCLRSGRTARHVMSNCPTGTESDLVEVRGRQFQTGGSSVDKDLLRLLTSAMLQRHPVAPVPASDLVLQSTGGLFDKPADGKSGEDLVRIRFG